jgi:ribonuclease J
VAVTVKVEVLSGNRSIGGNFVRVEDGDRVLIFDQGIRFDVMKRFYAGFIAPRGLRELREIGAVPRVEWYNGAGAIYISHMHLDHLGLLSNIPARVEVYVPNLGVYELLEEKWSSSPSWLSMVPKKHYLKLCGLKPMEVDRNGVAALPVSHSAFPAYAFLYFGSDKTVLYTGDFRVEGFLDREEFEKVRGGPGMLDYIRENNIKVDVLVIEGTNLGSAKPPISPAEEHAMIVKILEGHSLVVSTAHPLDFEHAYFMMKTDRPVYIASDSIAKFMEAAPQLPSEPKLLAEYVKAPLKFEASSMEELGDDSLVVASYYEVVDLLRDLASNNLLPKNAAVLISEPEPRIEEAQAYEAMMNWFMNLGVQAYSMRVSGHYYPYQLKKIIDVIRPKEVLLVHTLAFIKKPV